MKVDAVEHSSNDFLFTDIFGDADFSRKLATSGYDIVQLFSSVCNVFSIFCI